MTAPHVGRLCHCDPAWATTRDIRNENDLGVFASGSHQQVGPTKRACTRGPSVQILCSGPNVLQRELTAADASEAVQAACSFSTDIMVVRSTAKFKSSSFGSAACCSSQANGIITATSSTNPTSLCIQESLLLKLHDRNRQERHKSCIPSANVEVPEPARAHQLPCRGAMSSVAAHAGTRPEQDLKWGLVRKQRDEPGCGLKGLLEAPLKYTRAKRSFPKPCLKKTVANQAATTRATVPCNVCEYSNLADEAIGAVRFFQSPNFKQPHAVVNETWIRV